MSTQQKATLATALTVCWILGAVVEAIFFKTYYLFSGLFISGAIIGICIITGLIYLIFYEMFK